MVSPLSSAQARNPAELVQSYNHQLASFPHLEHPEFEKACSTLLNRFELHAHSQTQWTAVESVSQNGTTFLRITKPLALHPEVADASENSEEAELDEDDDEVAMTAMSNPVVVHYDILLSLSYRVPVLYFSISDSQHRYPPSLDTLYSYIIPPAFRAQTKHVGVIGGITMAVRFHGLREPKLSLRVSRTIQPRTSQCSSSILAEQLRSFNVVSVDEMSLHMNTY